MLLIEDDRNDAGIIRDVVDSSGVECHLHVVFDGLDALDYLDRRGAYVDAPRPDLVLLDLGVPAHSGFDVLAHLKRDPALKTIPTVVLTGSQSERDVWRSYNLHANAYLVKPVSVTDFKVTLGRLIEFYLKVAQLPPGSPPT